MKRRMRCTFAQFEIGHTPRKFPAFLQQPFASTHIMLKNYIKYLSKMQEFLSNSGQKMYVEIFFDFCWIFVQYLQIRVFTDSFAPILEKYSPCREKFRGFFSFFVSRPTLSSVRGKTVAFSARVRYNK